MGICHALIPWYLCTSKCNQTNHYQGLHLAPPSIELEDIRSTPCWSDDHRPPASIPKPAGTITCLISVLSLITSSYPVRVTNLQVILSSCLLFIAILLNLGSFMTQSSKLPAISFKFLFKISFVKRKGKTQCVFGVTQRSREYEAEAMQCYFLCMQRRNGISISLQHHLLF